MSIKEKHDWSTYSDRDSALDIYGNTIRQGLAGDSYNAKTRFKAVALTDMFPLNANQAMAIDGGSTGGGANNNQRYAFKARIIGANSPHSFLPDPCDPAFSPDDNEAYRAIVLHTTFISNEASSGDNVTRGDIVVVELNKTGFSYDLKYGRFMTISSVENPSSDATEQCANLVGLVGEWGGPPPPAVGTMASMAAGGMSTVQGGCGIKVPRESHAKWAANNGAHPDWIGRTDLRTGENVTAPVPSAEFKITSPFGSRNKGHHAVDIGAKKGTPIYAIADGTVKDMKLKPCPEAPRGKCGPGKGSVWPCNCGSKMGNYIKLLHTAKSPSGHPIQTYYGHMTAYAAGLKKDDPVKAGQQIGQVGSTGNSSGPHLHMQVHFIGAPNTKSSGKIDPMAYLMQNTSGGTKCGAQEAGGEMVATTETTDANLLDDSTVGEKWEWVDEDKGSWREIMADGSYGPTISNTETPAGLEDGA
jgi:murein DD-endopeptidase MepM/ murein hydrolase activator NlpD